MNGIDFIADTNFLINLKEGNKIVEPFIEYNFAVSFITEIELLGAFSLKKDELNIYKEILNECYIFNLDDKLKQKCIDLRKSFKIKIPDAIIAATAIINNIPLITSDADFKTIKNLELIILEK